MTTTNGKTTGSSRVQYEAIQSVTAFKVTEPRLTQPILAADPTGTGIFQKCFNVILYYRAMVEGETGWAFTGWIKESLGRAFTEQPLLCGRLRRGEGSCGGELEIVSNDSGARIIEAKIGLTLDEFLGSERRADGEAELVHWKDIDMQNPQFCPLFNILVTNFQCGGYSIGISCSLLLADPISTVSLIKRWATIYNDLNLIPGDNAPKKHIFYLSNIKRTDSPPTSLAPSPCPKTVRTLVFKADTIGAKAGCGELSKALALLCAEEAEKKLKNKMGSKFALLVKEGSGNVKAESVEKTGAVQVKSEMAISEVTLESLGLSGVAFRRGNEPALVSHWVASGDGFVMVAPCGGDDGVPGFHVYVTIPRE